MIHPPLDFPIGPSADELTAAIAAYRRALASAKTFDFDLSALDRIGLKIFVAPLTDGAGFSNDGFGYGATPDEARVGALGEMTETYHTHLALMRAPACEGLSHQEMVARFGVDLVLDPLTLGLPAGSPYTADLPLRWVEVRRWPDQSTAWAPRECIAPGAQSYATQSSTVLQESGQQPGRLFPPITCGLGAGLSLEQAIAHGVLELLQRDGNCTSFRAMDRGIDIELDVVRDPTTRNLIERLASLGIHVRAKLASTEFGLTNLYVIAETDPEREDFPLMVTACGEAVHPNRERALRKALLEYLASRCRKAFMHGPIDSIARIAPADYLESIVSAVNPATEEPRALREMTQWLQKSPRELRRLLNPTVFSSHHRVKFSELPSVPDEHVAHPADRLQFLTEKLAQENITIYYFDASPEGDEMPRVVKCIAPKLEGETMSYLRIGSRGAARLLERGSSLVHDHAPQDADLAIRTPEKITRYLRVAEVHRVVGECYPLYREPGSHSAPITLQALRSGER